MLGYIYIERELIEESSNVEYRRPKAIFKTTFKMLFRLFLIIICKIVFRYMLMLESTTLLNDFRGFFYSLSNIQVKTDNNIKTKRMD